MKKIKFSGILLPIILFIIFNTFGSKVETYSRATEYVSISEISPEIDPGPIEVYEGVLTSLNNNIGTISKGTQNIQIEFEDENIPDYRYVNKEVNIVGKWTGYLIEEANWYLSQTDHTILNLYGLKGNIIEGGTVDEGGYSYKIPKHFQINKLDDYDCLHIRINLTSKEIQTVEKEGGRNHRACSGFL